MTDDAFEAFWRAYPRRIAKGRARTAFRTAIKITDLETMLAAIETYRQRKPERIDFKHPATWLNGECWDDEWPEPEKKPQTGGAPRSFDYKPKGNVVHLQTGNTVFLREFNQKKAGE